MLLCTEFPSIVCTSPLVVGFGYSAVRSGYFFITETTPESCIAGCYQKRQKDNAVNGLRFNIGNKWCICYRGDNGHTFKEQELHFRFV